MQPDIDAQKQPEAAMDRRRHPRYRFSVPITIRSADGVVMPGISIEISTSGISAITADLLELNDTVELEVIAAGKVRAVIRHNIGKIYGFEFLNLTPEQTQQIRERCKLLPLYRGKTLGISHRSPAPGCVLQRVHRTINQHSEAGFQGIRSLIVPRSKSLKTKRRSVPFEELLSSWSY